ncbi:methylase [Lujinxingia litoralis]|uniref:Methylase n=1 Tax=Lujinxingia litoralis TaxID=2211119 RepID=A0A328CAM3_9DELT|nr:DUF938 domain-containing protein [Lujinxingia litoralis]RAL22853.1 methylase [Lujinxingia litoralis]
MPHDKPHSPSCLRNQEPILHELRDLLRDASRVWEIGSGTGQHAVFFGRALPHLTWMPSDRPEHHPGIEAWRNEAALPNVEPVRTFDLFDLEPPVDEADALLAINVIHIAPWEATARLFAHADTALRDDGQVILYGPYIHPQRPLEPSNQRFDQWLRERDLRSGIRELEKIDACARARGFERVITRRLPANNDLLVYRRTR